VADRAWPPRPGGRPPGLQRRFPPDPLRELASLAPRRISFHGYQSDAEAVVRDLAPAMAAPLLADGADAALLVPV
jgi:hypothetical protein